MSSSHKEILGEIENFGKYLKKLRVKNLKESLLEENSGLLVQVLSWLGFESTGQAASTGCGEKSRRFLPQEEQEISLKAALLGSGQHAPSRTQ